MAVVAPHLTEPLFQPVAVSRIQSLAPHLPGDCAGVLEARLASSSGVVDFSVRLLEPSQAEDLAKHVQPSHLGDFLRIWAEPGGSFRSLSAVWLEFDLDQEIQGLPVPTVCAKLLPEAAPEWVLDGLLPALHGGALDSAQRTSAARCLAALPPSAALLYAFSLLSRGSGDTLRLEISGLDSTGILDYLRTVAPETLPAASEGTALLAGAERLHLSLDIGSQAGREILPRIGIEGSFTRLPYREPGWRMLFDRLVERRLCSAEKRDAALAWPGYDSFWTAPDRWPAAPQAIASACVRSLSHLKVVCQPDRAPEAKVYLMFGPLASPGSAGAAISSASRSASRT